MAGMWPGNWIVGSEGLPSEKVVIVDIDGVLADASGRQHLMASGPKRYSEFFDRCDEDALINSTASLLVALDSKYAIILLTGRPIRVQEKTVAWLSEHGIEWDVLVMRDFGDYGIATEFKERELARIRSMGLEPVLALDDDPSNAAMFNRHDVPCLYIHSGYYE